MSKDDSIAEKLHEIQQQIKQTCLQAKRDEKDVTLVAVSKFHPVYEIEEAINAGQYIFGENRVQEATKKFSEIKQKYTAIKLHIIGGLQTNKAYEACVIADMIESLDRPSLSKAIEKGAQKAGKLPDLLIQVNLGDEPQKYGVSREESDYFIEQSQKKFGEKIKGLMIIPPINEPPDKYFKNLKDIAHRHGLKTLSMGMSHDYQIAIKNGATLIRVGTAIFGQRPSII